MRRTRDAAGLLVRSGCNGILTNNPIARACGHWRDEPPQLFAVNDVKKITRDDRGADAEAAELIAPSKKDRVVARSFACMLCSR